MNIVTLPLGEHVAHLDPINGTGLPALPDNIRDVWLGSESLHAADWNAAVAELGQHGYIPLTDDDDTLIHQGTTALGALAVALITRDVTQAEPDLDALSRSWDSLGDSVQIVSLS